MQLKKYYKDIVSLMATLSLLATVLFINKYDVKQLYREFATLRLKVDIQEKVIIGMNYRVQEMSSIYTLLQIANKLKLGAAYDTTNSDLSLTDERGSLEFILKYQF